MAEVLEADADPYLAESDPYGAISDPYDDVPLEQLQSVVDDLCGDKLAKAATSEQSPTCAAESLVVELHLESVEHVDISSTLRDHAQDDVLDISNDELGIRLDTVGETRADAAPTRPEEPLDDAPSPCSSKPLLPSKAAKYKGDDHDDDFDSDIDKEPQWLLALVPSEDAPSLEETMARCDYMDGLEDVEAELSELCPKLGHYLIGHPQALVTKKRKRPSAGMQNRYFVPEASTDVMAEKVVTGCWACGKLDHESQDCPYKRCFICSEQGHDRSECSNYVMKCDNCMRSGHVTEACPLIAYRASLMDDPEDAFWCRCLKCMLDGHIQCGSLPSNALPMPRPPALRPRLPLLLRPGMIRAQDAGMPFAPSFFPVPEGRWRPTAAPPRPSGRLWLRPRGSVGHTEAWPSQSAYPASGGPPPGVLAVGAPRNAYGRPMISKSAATVPSARPSGALPSGAPRAVQGRPPVIGKWAPTVPAAYPLQPGLKRPRLAW